MRVKLASASVLAALWLGVPADLAAAGSPNGAIAFAGKRLGKPVIYMRDPALPRAQVIPTRGWARDPALSPGGRRIAFTRRGRLGAQIWSGYTDGSALIQLTSGPRDFAPRWSPDGDAVAFARGPAGPRDIYTVSADGVEVRRLTRAPADDRSPAWSVLDRVAFVRRVDRDGDIYSMPARGGRPRRLTPGPAHDSSPAWHPRGRKLAFARRRPGGSDLYVVNADGSRPRRLTALPGAETDPAWSPGGRSIVFSHRRGGRRRLYVVRVGRTVSRLASRRLRALGSSRAEPRAPHWQRAGLDPEVAAAGDIACDPTDPHFRGGLGTGRFCRQRQTSDLLLRMDLSAILAPGDLQYEDGALWRFQHSFHPSWGRLKPLIRPAPGNHEYGTPGAAGYFDYFNGVGQATGPAGRRDQGYYSFDIGTWHLVALNSECGEIGGCGPGSPQERWLRADLAANQAVCTLAFWHHPRFTSGRHSAEGAMLPAWNALYEAGAEVVLNGHEHFYERFAPLSPAGSPDAARGIREFIVGTGGRSLFGRGIAAAGSEARHARTGVLKLTLGEGRYRWKFVTTPFGRIVDSGDAACH